MATTKDIFDHMRPNLTDAQVAALYALMEQGASLDTIAAFAGLKPAEAKPEPTAGGFKLGSRSIERLGGVNANLVRVVKRAIEISEVDFTVLEGVRTKEQAYINYGKGRTGKELSEKGVPTKYANPGAAKVTWLNNPLSSKHMTGAAVDIAPYPIDWNDLKRFDLMADAMFRAAKEIGVKIRWGADWNGNGVFREKGESDSPHFEV